MAAAAAEEGGALPVELPPVPSSPPYGGGTERALEEAAASGTLSLAGRRLRAFPVAAARRWDLSDTTQADLSRNRFGDVPAAACHLVSLECLSLHHNCLRRLSPAIANLQALTHLDLSRNQLSSLPSCLFLLPLRVLNASGNCLVSLPGDIGGLGTLRQLDLGCNRLRALPSAVGRLKSLRDLSLRRNQLTLLPPELAELPLVRLDFSCNRVTAIPRCFHRLQHLQTLLVDNNPLQSPPAQICLKGKVHIFKYLQAEATSTTRPPPPGFSEEQQRGGLDSGFNSVDSGSKRWSGNESIDEFSELPQPPRGRRCGAGDSDPEPVDFIEGSLTGGEEEEEEEPPLEGSSPRGDTAERATGGRVVSVPWRGEGRRRRPQTLQLWQERERGESPSDPGSSPQRPPRTRAPAKAPLDPPSSSPRVTPKPSSDPNERELMAELRQSIESLLQLRLPEELGGDGELLPRLAAHLLPSPTACKLSAANVGSFLDALGVAEAARGQPQHVLEEQSPARLVPTLRGLLGVAPPPPPQHPLINPSHTP